MSLWAYRDSGKQNSDITLLSCDYREILMTASPNIKTPAMEVPLHHGPGAKAEGERLKKYFTRVSLNQVGLLSGIN